ncbi:LOW QUALITY PROTEIN: olfactory receptor 186-like [Mesocricetus auratus]|uniref:LOW QUALITY PROTEIN: olfactory receptor 186-like n=1 Tax=Mesocricetus auratus TaxID=10036 RepID=A0A1U8C2E1_MESAU|nr:LOW QUALITY PROTEIN: olfactory receptor 186-like [Mesocricetus auratus]
MSSEQHLEKENATLLTEFVLTGLAYHQGLQVPLFLLFLVLYVFTVVGNLGLIALIYSDPQLHIPMYIFLGSLAFVGAWISSPVTPNMLVDLLSKNKMISLSECLIQFFAFSCGGTTECFLLGAMAYDCYVAICKPLLYPVIMTNKLCIRILISIFVGSFLHSLFHILFLLRLTFCDSNIIHHFYCDIMSLLKISCSDTSINFLLVFTLAGSIQVVTMVRVIVSYTCIIFTILQSKSFKGIEKAFSTCGAHLLSVSLYYGSLLFMYVRPASPQTDDQDMMDSLFCTVIIPVLNPVIYSLRNQQVKDSVIKALKGNVYI